MKIIVSLIFLLTVYAFSDNAYWTDENGCGYCLYGEFKDGKCVHTSNAHGYFPISRAVFPEELFDVKKLSGNFFKFKYEHQTNLHVFCSKKETYCLTIDDSMVVKLSPSLKERKSYCKQQSLSKKNKGMLYNIPIRPDQVNFLCDFVRVDYEKSVLEVLGSGVCPVRVKNFYKSIGNSLVDYNLYITKGKSVEIEVKHLSITRPKGLWGVGDGSFYVHENDFFTLGSCSNSNCEIRNYKEKQAQNFDVKCDFIIKDENQIGKVKVLREGVCPIEVSDSNKKKQVYYLRSVKTDDGFKLLMTNKKK